MDINKVKEEKVSLELAIGELIEQFEDRTGTSVTNLHIRSRSYVRLVKDRRIKAWVEIVEAESLNDDDPVLVSEATA